MKGELEKIPYLGLGIGLRRALAEKIMRYADEIDVLEVIAEYYFPNKKPKQMPFLQGFAARFPIIPHGVKLSIGSIPPLEEDFLEGMRGLSSFLGASYYSDHFALTRVGRSLDTDHLAPLWYTKEALDHVSIRIDSLQQALGIPLVLENITTTFIIGEADYEEPEFITKVCERTGCGLLLDITNIHINAHNRGFDALEMLKRYPMESVVQLHLAGGEMHGTRFSDTHSQEIEGPNEGVWELLRYVAAHASPKAVIIERDANFKEDFETMVLRDLRRARSIIGKTGSEASSPVARTQARTSPRIASSQGASGALRG